MYGKSTSTHASFAAQSSTVLQVFAPPGAPQLAAAVQLVPNDSESNAQQTLPTGAH